MLMDPSGLKITPENEYDVAVITGVGLGGLHTIETWHKKLLESGPNKITPFMIPMLISNMGPGQISIFTGAKGPKYCYDNGLRFRHSRHWHGFRPILLGRAKSVISGGVEFTITPGRGRFHGSQGPFHPFQ